MAPEFEPEIGPPGFQNVDPKIRERVLFDIARQLNIKIPDKFAAQKAGFQYVDPKIREHVLLDMARQLEEIAKHHNRFTADGIRYAAKYVRNQASSSAEVMPKEQS